MVMLRINFWLERPPFAIVGFLKPLKEILGDSLQIFVRDDSISNRKGFDEKASSELGCIFVHKDLSDLEDKNGFSNSINIINGFNSFVYSFLTHKRKEDKTVKIGCYTEMPAAMGKFKALKSILLKIKYRRLIRAVADNIDFLLPIGEMAQHYYKKIGWNKLSYPFVYIPDLLVPLQQKDPFKLENGSYCYVGRNDYSNKGLNKAIKFFGKNRHLKLTIIGNYGNNSNDVLLATKKYSNIVQLPSKQPTEVLDYLNREHIKCVLVPSNTDGWNPNVYMALLAGVPCIATVNSGSSDLISKFKFGLVCDSTYHSFKKAIEQFENMDSTKRNEFFDNAFIGSKTYLPDQIAKDLLNFLKEHFE